MGVVLVLVSAAWCASVPVAAASNSDAQATHAYLFAQYKLVTALLHEAAAPPRAESAAAAQIARECPGVVSGMPKEPRLKSSLSPRGRGENARLSQQEGTIEAELYTVVERPGNLHRPAEEAYAAEVRQLSWSNPAIAAAIQATATARLEALSAPAPPFCADARAWAQSGYRALSPSSREFKAVREAARSSEREAERSLGSLLKPYENASDRALIRKINTLEIELIFSGFDDVRTVRRLERILGFPQADTEEPKQITLGHGRTDAGTRFEVSSGGGGGLLGAPGSCRRSATVGYTRPGAPGVLVVGGPNNPICLSSPRYRHPAVFCEAGIETIQTAVPASVRSVTLVLADGRTIKSRVVRVPRRHGGPAGIYAQELRGSTSHAVSLIELNAGGGDVLTMELPRYRCVKPHKEPEELPTSTELASGRTPEGENFTISTFGSLKGAEPNGNILGAESNLSVDIGLDPELTEPVEFGASKAFPWSLSIGCNPHPYAILYGILAPPGNSVMARTPQGAVALNVVPVEPRLHAKGPLVYGVFSTLPSELTVLAANGSTVYTENLQAQATEVAQFCEGYAEP